MALELIINNVSNTDKITKSIGMSSLGAGDWKQQMVKASEENCAR